MTFNVVLTLILVILLGTELNEWQIFETVYHSWAKWDRWERRGAQGSDSTLLTFDPLVVLLMLQNRVGADISYWALLIACNWKLICGKFCFSEIYITGIGIILSCVRFFVMEQKSNSLVDNPANFLLRCRFQWRSDLAITEKELSAVSTDVLFMPDVYLDSDKCCRVAGACILGEIFIFSLLLVL
jgi:hypothetical protein